MNQYNLKDYQQDKFKRITGVSKATSLNMCNIIKDILILQSSNHIKGGRLRKLKLWKSSIHVFRIFKRRTYDNIALLYGVDESSAIQSDEFKKEIKDNLAYKVIRIDVSEHTIQRPKKNKENMTLIKNTYTNKNTLEILKTE